MLKPFRQQAEKIQKTGEVVDEPEPTNVVPVRQVTSWSEVLTHGASTLTDILLAASFIPFLAYFLLTWQNHARSATVMLFPPAAPPYRVRDAWADWQNAAELHCRESADRVADLRRQRGHLRSVGCSVFLFHRISPAASSAWFRTSGIVLAMVPPILVGLGQLEAGDLLLVVIFVVATAPVRAQRSLPQNAGQPSAAQSAGRHDRPAVLGSGSGAQLDSCSPFPSLGLSRSSSTTSSR